MKSNALVLVTLFCAAAVLGAGAHPVVAQDKGQDPANEKKAGEDKAAKEKEKASKRAAIERDLPIAREKLAKAQKEMEDQGVDAQAAAAKADKELALARMRLETFESREAPSRTAKGELDLQQVKDGLDNAREELEQLELMYKEQDLADKTKEIVIRRARRELDRAQQRLKIQEGEHAILVERTLPHEREKLRLEVEEKERDVARTARNSQKASMEKKIGLMSAEAEIKKLESDRASLEGDAK
jgi:hypothetical protein